jgi:hypothetical protein
MAWVKSVGGSLVYTGRLDAAKAFDGWAAQQGRPLVQELARQQPFCLFGKYRRARKLLWSELNTAATSGTLGAALKEEAARYARLPGELANIVQPDKFQADWRPFVIPRFLVNAVALRGMVERLGSSHMLTGLRGGQTLGAYFLQQFVAQMDAAYAGMNFGIRSPVATAHEWIVIDADHRFDWGHPPWNGHYYLVQTKAVGISKGRAAWLERASLELKASLGRMSVVDVQDIASSWRAWFEGRTTRLQELASQMAEPAF